MVDGELVVKQEPAYFGVLRVNTTAISFILTLAYFPFKTNVVALGYPNVLRFHMPSVRFELQPSEPSSLMHLPQAPRCMDCGPLKIGINSCHLTAATSRGIKSLVLRGSG